MKNRLSLPGINGAVFLMIQILCYPTVAGSAVESSSVVIRVENGMLTAAIKDAPLIDVLEKMADQTGIGFEIYAGADRKITANYSQIPVEEGLKRILSPSSHIILYSDKDSSSKKPKIHKIIIYDKSGGSSGQGIKRRPAGSADTENAKKTDPIIVQKPEEGDTEKRLEDYAEQLNDADPDVREEAVSDMADEYEEAALIYLEKALINDGNDEVRSAAAEEIGYLESERGIDILAKGLNDPDEDVREAVVDALGEIGGEKALPVLRQALKDKNEDIREAAADLIEEIEEDEKGE